MPKVMIITVGTGETVSHGICCSIRQQNPNHIVFVLTKESKEKTLPLILQDEVIKEKTWEEAIWPDENDVEEIRSKCKAIIDGLLIKNIVPKDIAVDYTAGTKAMSAGVVLAALDKKIGSLVYVSGKRDKNGRVVSGMERVIGVEPNRIYVDSLFCEAVRLFNSCQFKGCTEIAQQTRDLIADTSFQDKMVLLEQLAHAYSLWDTFDLTRTFALIDKFSHNELLSLWGIKSRVEKNKMVLHKEKNKEFCTERVIDLLENAKRRGDLEKKYDDAVARLYRAIEYLAQLKIEERGLYCRDDKGNSDPEALDVDKLPLELREKYLKYKNSKDNKVKLGLYQDYELLFDLNDTLGQYFKEKYESGGLKKLLALRNMSILAHGFNPISESIYKEMVSVVEKSIKTVLLEMDDIVDRVRFPHIKLETKTRLIGD